MYFYIFPDISLDFNVFLYICRHCYIFLYLFDILCVIIHIYIYIYFYMFLPNFYMFLYIPIYFHIFLDVPMYLFPCVSTCFCIFRYIPIYLQIFLYTSLYISMLIVLAEISSFEGSRSGALFDQIEVSR